MPLLAESLAAVLDELEDILWEFSRDPETVVDAITAWRDRRFDQADIDPAHLDRVADVLSDAVRQYFEQVHLCGSIRICEGGGGRVAFTWSSGSGPASPKFREIVLRAVKKALP